MENNKILLEDIKTYIKISSNENYKERLLEAYTHLKQNNINSYDEFEKSNIGIGAFSYTELTLFDRLKEESYGAMLAGYMLELKSISNLPKDYGDQLASWGTIGHTPYRESYIRECWITHGLTEEEKNKFYR